MSWSQAVEKTVSGLGYELVDVERSAGGLLRVYIDRVPGRAYPTGEHEFVTVEDCEAVTRQLQYVLEVENLDYARLEVSSPGLDRPLMRASQFRRFVGSRAHVRTHAPLLAGASQKNFHGRIVAVDPDPASPDDEHTGVVRLADQDDPEVVHLVPLTLIKRANLIYEGDL